VGMRVGHQGVEEADAGADGWVVGRGRGQSTRCGFGGVARRVDETAAAVAVDVPAATDAEARLVFPEPRGERRVGLAQGVDADKGRIDVFWVAEVVIVGRDESCLKL